MTYHVFSETNRVPGNFTIDMRGAIDSSGPHLLAFGCRTTIPDPLELGIQGMQCRYETDNGEVRTIAVPDCNLYTSEQTFGGVWYSQQDLIEDVYYPLGDGPQPTQPLGLLELKFTGGRNLGANFACISYRAIFQTLDGNSSVVYHPAL